MSLRKQECSDISVVSFRVRNSRQQFQTCIYKMPGFQKQHSIPANGERHAHRGFCCTTFPICTLAEYSRRCSGMCLCWARYTKSLNKSQSVLAASHIGKTVGIFQQLSHSLCDHPYKVPHAHRASTSLINLQAKTCISVS